MASDLETFDAKLRDLMGQDEKVRPFVCEGSPLDCQIFIVGFNPATTGVSFWDFWKLPYGFNRKAWLSAYESEREEQGLKMKSNTRQRIDCIVKAAHPVKCLETNIYAVPSRKQSDLRRGEHSTDLFGFLLTWIKPRVVFAHGNRAVKHVQKVLEAAELKPPLYTWTSRQVGDLFLVVGSHLAYGWSLDDATKLGGQLRAKCSR